MLIKNLVKICQLATKLLVENTMTEIQCCIQRVLSLSCATAIDIKVKKTFTNCLVNITINDLWMGENNIPRKLLKILNAPFQAQEQLMNQ
jgi:hypothetical protein